MRAKCGLLNNPINNEYDMLVGVSYFWYILKNGNTVGQGFYIESDTKSKTRAKLKIRKIIESNSEFLHWV